MKTEKTKSPLIGWNKAFQALRPPPKITVSQWASKHLYLSSEDSSEPGRYNPERAPFQISMMDAVNDPSINTVVFMTSAQIGKTTILKSIIGFYITQEPSPILMMHPTEAMAEAFSKDRLAPMIRDSPELTQRVALARARDSDNTILHKGFPGGHLTLVGSNSPASLASRPIRIVLCDELDRYPSSAGTQGDPVDLAVKRSTTFWNRKTVLTSTPTIKNASRIELAFNDSDQRAFFVPCPICGQFQTLEWRSVTWTDNNPDTAYVSCKYCNSVIAEKDKYGMLKKGEWRAMNTSNSVKGVAGFAINELYSPWRRWKEIVRNFLSAKRNQETLRVWVNTALGECWEDIHEAQISDHEILRRREAYSHESLPDKILLLTAGVDVQDDRLEMEIVGWYASGVGEPEESWGIEYKVIYGDPVEQSTWQRLDQSLLNTYQTSDGRMLKISAVGIDSGGHHTETVYRFCHARIGRCVYAVKGMAGNRPLWPLRASKGLNNKYSVYIVGVDSAKESIQSRLRILPNSPGYVHIPVTYTETWAKQLMAEKVRVKYRLGRVIREWVCPEGRRTEALDCRVYAMAALSSLHPNWKILCDNAEALRTGLTQGQIVRRIRFNTTG